MATAAATITLVKTRAATGAYIAGLGTDREARYTVKGHEHISIKPVHGGAWWARDEKAGKVIAMGKTLGALRDNLANVLPA